MYDIGHLPCLDRQKGATFRGPRRRDSHKKQERCLPKTRPSKSNTRRLEKRNSSSRRRNRETRGAARWWLAARLRTRMPTGCSVCCRGGITSDFARIFTVFRWSTGSLSTVRTSPSDLSISSNAGVPGHDAGGAVDRRYGCGGRPATGGLHPLQTRQRHDHQFAAA
jgi:hypothetical protein